LKTKHLLISILLVLLSAGAFAQGENNIWCFGESHGMDFSTGSPVFFTSASEASEGCATVCSKTGSLLFYCGKYTVFDRTHTAMPNGTSISGDFSSTQGYIVCSLLGNDSLYFLFTIRAKGTPGELKYSLINMNLNGGKGDVVAGVKNLPIRSAMSEKAVIAGYCPKQWLITHHRDSAIFYAYLLDGSTTIGAPVVSKVGSKYFTNDYTIGEMKISKDFSKIAAVNINGNPGCELFDFDVNTGIVSGFSVFDSTLGKNLYGVEFSPDGKLLYVGFWPSGGIYQYDLTAGSPSAIALSKYKVYNGTSAGFKIGPDDMIYVYTDILPTNFSRIQNPNTKGAGCNFQLNFLTTSITATSFSYGFGNRFVPHGVNKIGIKTHTDTICSGKTIKIKSAGTANFLWSDGLTLGERTLPSATSDYWVKSENGCLVTRDTFHIIEQNLDSNFSTKSTSFCESGLIELRARPGSDSILWYDGSKVESKIFAASTYNIWVKSHKKCTQSVDTFNVTVKPSKVTNITKDTSICFKPSAKIIIPNTFQTYLWNGGNTGTDTTLYSNGRVIVVAKDTINCNISKQDYTVSFVNFSSNIPDTSTCNEDTIILDATIPNPAAAYRWNVGDTTAKLKATKGSMYVFITVNGCTLIDSVNVKQFPMKVNIGEDTSLCKGTKTILKADIDNVSYKWSTGATSQSIEVSESGNYGITIFKDACSGKSEVKINFVNCDNCTAFPSGFTPNNDGINDYFKPIFNCPPVSYQIKILSRWGQEVYSSINPNDKWDGTSNGTPLDGGVYFYMLKVKFEAQDDEEKLFKGEITLLR
jgi:gliding motility-associated-like protein